MRIDFEKEPKVLFTSERKEIRETIPEIVVDGKHIRQSRYNFYRNRTKEEKGKPIVSGFPLKDDRQQRIKAPHGFVDGEFIGFIRQYTGAVKSGKIEKVD